MDVSSSMRIIHPIVLLVHVPWLVSQMFRGRMWLGRILRLGGCLGIRMSIILLVQLYDIVIGRVLDGYIVIDVVCSLSIFM